MAETVSSGAANKHMPPAVRGVWWFWAIQATLALLFGIVAVFWPSLTLLALVYIFSAFILALGIVETINGLVGFRRRSSWWITLLIGLASVAVGVYLARHPHVTLQTFVILIGLLLVGRGIFELGLVFADKMSGWMRVLLVFAGLAAITVGIFIIMQPVTGGVVFVWALGLYSLLTGVIGLTVAFTLREFSHHNSPTQPA